MFEAQAFTTPEAVAVVEESRHLTYGDLDAAANRLAHYLRSLGLQPEGDGSLPLDREMELPLVELAILKAAAPMRRWTNSAPEPAQAFISRTAGPAWS